VLAFGLLSAWVCPGGTLRAEAHEPQPAARPAEMPVPVLAVALAPRLVRGPYLVVVGDNAIAAAWETDLPARGILTIEPVPPQPALDVRAAAAATPGRTRTPRSTGAVRIVRAEVVGLRQVVRLPGLEPGRRYQYSVELEAPGARREAAPPGSRPPGSRPPGDATTREPLPGSASASPPAELEAPPRRDGPARFVVYGDMRAPGHAAHAQVVAGILRERPSLVLNTGDLVAAGGDASAWQRYFEITRALGSTTPVVPALGNHESYLGGASRSWALFGLKSAGSAPASGYASFDWGALHFVVLDTNALDAEQLAWLTRDLAAAARRRPRAIFAICHEGPWSSGPHGGSSAMERDVVPILAAGGVTLLFAGHDHLYERGAGPVRGGGAAPRRLPYVVTGGGGAPLYNPTCEVVSPESAGAAGSRGAPASGLPPCPPSVEIVRKAYHYIVVDVDEHGVRVCPRAPDGTAIEPCWSPPAPAQPPSFRPVPGPSR
jgi:3',5'-cyclic AMP phosphodiesterase CpdA